MAPFHEASVLLHSSLMSADPHGMEDILLIDQGMSRVRFCLTLLMARSAVTQRLKLSLPL